MMINKLNKSIMKYMLNTMKILLELIIDNDNVFDVDDDNEINNDVFDIGIDNWINNWIFENDNDDVELIPIQ